MVLFTDFGSRDLYVGQVKAVLAERAPRARVVDALHDAPAFAIEPAAHLLAALAPRYPRNAVFFAVVDPGVGGPRDAIAVRADGRTFVGPDNGLLSIVWQRARRRRCWRITWRPRKLSRSFHGRDLFAPVAAALAKRVPRGWLAPKRRLDVDLPAEDLAQVMYIDHYGNAMTGLRAASVSPNSEIRANGKTLRRGNTFEAARAPFWYENSIGLVELAAPRASAARLLRLKVGSPIRISK
ncbi:MAG TPA: SAM-dependent chlorinase/fluorinase [Burkholderiales bacterium]